MSMIVHPSIKIHSDVLLLFQLFKDLSLDTHALLEQQGVAQC